MSDLEFLIFAAIAIFFAVKLYSVFGKTNGDEKERAAEASAYAEKLREAVAKNKKTAQPAIASAAAIAPVEETVPAHLADDVASAKKIDPAFTLKKFVEGASQAFEMVVAGFAQKKREALKFLLSDEIYKNFDAEIAEREKNGVTASTSVVAIDAAEVMDVEIKGNICQIVVKFVSEQIHFLKDRAGEIIEGSKSQIDRVSEIWTFERNLTSKKPNWTVIGIQTA